MEVYTNYCLKTLALHCNKATGAVLSLNARDEKLPKYDNAAVFDDSLSYRFRAEALTNGQADKLAAAQSANPTHRYKAYVSSIASTPREIIRKTYDIARSPSTADIIVLPAKEHNFENWRSGYYVKLDVVENGNPKTYFYNISLRFVNPQTGKIEEYASSVATENFLDLYFDSSIKNHIIRSQVQSSMQFKGTSYARNALNMYKWDDAMAIVFDNTLADPNKFYVIEDELPMEMPNKISVDSLIALYHCKEEDLVEKTLIGCNWKDYPFTIYQIADYKEVRTFCRSRTFGRSKAYKTFSEKVRSMAYSSMITPQDYNMFQDFVFRLLGVNGQGLITREKYEKYGDFIRWIPNKVAIRKMVVTEDIDIWHTRGQWEK